MIAMKASPTPESTKEAPVTQKKESTKVEGRKPGRPKGSGANTGPVERISAVVPKMIMEILRNFVAQKTEEGTDLTLTEVYIEALKHYIETHDIRITDLKIRSGPLRRGRRKVVEPIELNKALDQKKEDNKESVKEPEAQVQNESQDVQDVRSDLERSPERIGAGALTVTEMANA